MKSIPLASRKLWHFLYQWGWFVPPGQIGLTFPKFSLRRSCFSQDTKQKQSFAEVLQNRCSSKFRKFLRKITVLESLFNKVVDLQAWNFIKKDSNTGAFLWHLRNFLKTPFFIEHLRWLLLVKKSKTCLQTYLSNFTINILFYWKIDFNSTSFDKINIILLVTTVMLRSEY